jgi:hypothetical protein
MARATVGVVVAVKLRKKGVVVNPLFNIDVKSLNG